MYERSQRHSEESDRHGYASPASGWIAESRNPHPIFVSASFHGAYQPHGYSKLSIWKIPRISLVGGHMQIHR
ncbi:hypothetical protein PITC_096120 [Penicillium italicum]|uniref:Uncharacterized protein n=1 Tax=Penicillium italicum TaxID=40296 RepID=A0A0A2KN75_PENIT|nr:hypothetical protein PITC_096120 [Penicillium italicum]